ncbi:MAG TPA: Ig-like domain-containing protein, partial [Gemmatimonadaceae bacterium]|nr:Ig-like domain-containing protein [Gemmatimonadaceae bacterium]
PIPPPPPVASITLSPPLITLDEGGTATFAATLRDAAGTVLTGRTIAWSSSDTTVGTVSSAGTVTGIAEGDTITIRATSEGQSATARVVVLSPYFIATSFSTQRYHTCAVRASGGTWCWGDFFHGRLGNPANTTMGTKMRVATTEVFVQVAAGQDNSCALTATGRAWCWGWSNGGANGDGVANLGVVQTPTAVVGNLQFVEIHAGASVACGITAARLAYCWGLNGNGVLGTGTGAASNPSPQPVVGLLPFGTYAMQFSHVCGITTSAQALCWGFGGLGNIGDGSFNASRSTPTAVSGGRKYVSIAAGYQHSCAIDDAGAAWCWGKGGFGQLGDGGTGNQFVPVRVSGNAVFTQVVTGDTHSCALTTAGDTWCWGRNQLGQLGSGSTASSLVPVPVVGAPKFARLFAAEVHTCGITSQRRVYCWGNNSFGQLGAAPSTSVNVPTALTRP